MKSHKLLQNTSLVPKITSKYKLYNFDVGSCRCQ